MNDSPLFSVLIANYNNAGYLEEALKSVYDQTYTNWEIVIVDDCSTDDSKSIYETLATDNRINIYHNDQNRGCGYTKRECVKLAKGDICGFLDPDDALVPNAIQRMIDLHVVNPHVSLVHSKYYCCDKDLKIQSTFDGAKQVPSNQPYFFNPKGIISHFCTFKKSYYDQTDGIDPFLQRAVDQDLYLKLYDAGETLFVDEALYYYRIHEGGISTNLNAHKALYWHWVVMFSTIRRRNLNFEDEFFNCLIPKSEYDHLMKQYKKIYPYSIFHRMVNRVKNLIKK